MTQPEQGVSWAVFDHLWGEVIKDPEARERMNREQRLLFAISQLRTDVNSDGFDFYFYYRGRDPLAVEAARLLGPEWHALVAEAFEAAEERYDELDERLYALEADHPADEVLDRFVRTHRAAFQGSGMIHP